MRRDIWPALDYDRAGGCIPALSWLPLVELVVLRLDAEVAGRDPIVAVEQLLKLGHDRADAGSAAGERGALVFVDIQNPQAEPRHVGRDGSLSAAVHHDAVRLHARSINLAWAPPRAVRR